MPLNCDCYGGCWGDHSKNWPFIRFPNSNEANKAFRLCHKNIPYGTYVIMGIDIRFETEAQKEILNRTMV